ncbi:ABC transporter permease [Flammeovirga pectinis]|uniref:ABC transporter permease n=1 Tax=Flammeovirga pectinis TaxID=2494373 RepID=A0A3Q9FRY3_9BACT|nr:FtsX-like permease family protein [Flammeovirga pectinis]AZQ64676.1 ABC transporter permease [Flammeovirga pectinis]
MKTYLKLAWHSLLKNPFFSFIILFGISITIMVVLFIGSILETSYGNNGAYKNIDNVLIAKDLKVIRTKDNGWSSSSFHYIVYKDYISNMTIPKEIALYENDGVGNLYYEDLGRKIERKNIDHRFTTIFPLDIVKGRGFIEEDITQYKKVILLTDQLAEDLFGEENPIGKKVKTYSDFYEVVGIVKQENKLRSEVYADIYTPIDINTPVNHEWHTFMGGVTVCMLFDNKDDLQMGVDEFNQIIATLPLDASKNESEITAKALTEKGWLFYQMLDVEDPKMYYVYVFIVALICLGIPALSLINLNITRVAERSSEIGIRKAFGASSIDLLKQLLIENLVTTLIGGIIGFILASLCIFLVNYFSWMGQNETLEINGILLVYGLTCTLLFSLLSGFYPALKISKFDIISSLKADKQ